MSDSARIRAELLRVTRRAYFQDRMFAATSGNLSIFDRERGVIYITPSSYPYEDMTEADMMAVDLDGNILEGPHRPSSEWRMHAAIYRGIDRVNAIVHTHSPYATAFAINGTPIPPALFEQAYFIGGEIPVAARAIPGTPAVGENCVAALKDRNGCLMANHGALAVGATLAEAYTRAVYIEDAAKAYALALAAGRPRIIPQEEIDTYLNK